MASILGIGAVLQGVQHVVRDRDPVLLEDLLDILGSGHRVAVDTMNNGMDNGS